MKVILVDAIHAFIIKEQGIFKEMHDLLEKYPNKKIILTNADDEQIKTFGLINLPYPLFTLKHNPDKTNPNYYRIMLKQFKLKPSEVIYFEHDASAVKSAQSVGINTYYYDSEKRDLVALKKFIDENVQDN